MFRPLRAAALLPVLCAGLLATPVLAPLPAHAQAYFAANDIRARTPSCRDNPNAPVKGYAVGQAGSMPTRTYSFVGCFNSMAECQRWLGPATGFFSGRIIQNRCEQRR